MEQSPEIGEIAKALSAVQGKIEGAKKDAENPAFKRDGKVLKYADLSSVWDACRAELSAAEIAVIQAPGECAGNQMQLTTMLLHSSGQWVRETLSIPLSKVDAHGYGSATTYARRYALAAMVGIAPEDDDGNAAVKPGAGAVDNSALPRSKPIPLTGKHKTRDGLRKVAGEIANALKEAADGGDPMFVEEVLTTYAEDIAQIQAEGPESWWNNPDYGLEAQIKTAKGKVGAND